MARKKAEFPSEEDEFEEVWDFRKIGIGIVLVILLLVGGYIAKRLILGQSIAPAAMVPKIPSLQTVLGKSTQSDTNPKPVNVSFSLPTQQDVQQKVAQIQQQVTHLNVADVASSSPQIQAVLQQIQNLPGASTNQVKQECYRLCDQL